MLRINLALALLAATLTGQAGARPHPGEATLACGTEIPWQATVDDALARAKECGRPVLWYVPTLAGSRMDRKDVIDLYMMCGPFASEEVATLLTRRLVPVKAEADRELGERFGIRFPDFVEPGLIVLDQDGRELARLDRITTFHAGWLASWLRAALDRAPPRDSDAVAAARMGKNQVALARALIEESAFADALPYLEGDAREVRILRAVAHARTAATGPEVEAALAALQTLTTGEDAIAARASLERGRLLLRRGDLAGALAALEVKAGASPVVLAESRFLAGVGRWLAGDQAGADQTWQALSLEVPPSRWTRKAAAELERFGPFTRGFERHQDLLPRAYAPGARTTMLSTTEADQPELVRRSVAFLLAFQGKDGLWRDSNYDFGGQDSLPNVYAAISALAALALLEHGAVDPQGTAAAVQRAFTTLADDETLAWADQDEIVWAHAYRLLLFERLAASDHALGDAARTHARRMVKHLADSQLENGSWRHEYANPFASATVLHALDRGRALGFDAGVTVLARGVEALLACRDENGTFTYAARRGGRRGRGTAVEGAAGRMPLCELSLLLHGRSDQARLVAAIEAGFEHHPRLEAVRKVDDHADAHANGGFFFWYDMLGRTLAIEAVEEPARRRRLAARQRALILEIPEIDGTFQESHETGRIYATAMALLCLAWLEPGRP